MVNRERIKQLEDEADKHIHHLHNIPEDISETYKKYYISYHMNEVERIEQEITNEYDR